MFTFYFILFSYAPFLKYSFKSVGIFELAHSNGSWNKTRDICSNEKSALNTKN